MLAASRDLLRRLNASGVPLEDLSKGWALPCEPSKGSVISADILHLHELLNSIVRSAPPGIGFQLGFQWRPDDYGPYWNVLRSCSNLIEVSWVLKHFQTSLRQPYFFDDCVTGDDWVVQFAASSPFGQGEVVIIEELLARTKIEIEQYTGEELRFKKLEVSYQAPDHKKMYEELFGCPISFGRPKTIVRLSRENLDRYIGIEPSSGDFKAEFREDVAGHADLRERVMLAILEALVFHGGTYPGMQQIAEMFGTSVSTLKRKLSQRDVNYRVLVDIVRQEYVAEYLALTSMTPKEIAYKAGFTNVNNFRRAFGRWMGMTPNEFRKAVQHSPRGLN